MRPATKELHFAIIRLLKGILSAWERWLRVYADDPPPQETTPSDGE